MDSSSSTTIGAILLVAAVAVFLVGASDWLSCIDAEQAKVAIADAAAENLPRSYFARARSVSPTCSETAPFGDGLNWYLVAGVLFLASIAAFMTRSNKTVAPEIPKWPEVVDRRPFPTREALPLAEPSEPIEVPHAVEISLDSVASESDQERDSQTLMAYVEARRSEASEASLAETSAPRLDGYYVPPGYDDKPILYVDSAAPQNDSENGRFKTLQSALSHAQTVALSNGKGVQIRVAPGVYQTSIEIPSNVVLVNQHLPDESSAKSRLRWVLAQELNDPDRVTIIGDPEIPYAVRLGSGTRHGIFGCHVVSRNSTNQCGIVVENAETAAIVNCVVENFSNSGVRLVRVGSELPGFGATISGSAFRSNRALQGGGVYSEESGLTIDACVFEGNRARNGGGLFAVRCRHAATIRATRFQSNRAQLPTKPTTDPMKLPLHQWGKQPGLGGAVYIRGSTTKLIDVECIANGSSIAGGAAAFIGSKVLIQNEKYASRFRENRSRIGGAIASIGWFGNESTSKFQTAQITENDARASGGGIAVIGHATVQTIDCKLASNIASGPASVGGGLSAHIGGQLDIQSCQVADNRSEMHGGGVSCVNGRLRVGGKTEIHSNRAGGSGGGLFAITEACEVTDNLVTHQQFEVPILCTISDSTIRYNKCGQTGAGLRAGNLVTNPTLPFGIKVTRASIRSNASVKNTPEICVTWAGEKIADDLAGLKRLILK